MTELHEHVHRVTYSECTLGNHVYYGRYLDMLEEARGEFFRALGHPLLALQQEGFALPVVELHLKYLAAARYDDVLTISTWVATLERVRFTLAHRLQGPVGQTLLQASTLHACSNLSEKPVRIPPALRLQLEQRLRSGSA